uniref:Cyclin-dependent kinase B1-1 n=1 Tax=Aegilops tauschii TaxID=37682 RepID=N1QQF1_AEGTA
MEKYEKLEKVGEGTYGKVYKAQDKATGQVVALKKTRLEMDETTKGSRPPRSATKGGGAGGGGKPVLYLVFEFLDTDLKKFVDAYRRGPAPKPLPTQVVKSFLYQLCKGIAHCHGHGVLHRDLKPQNLLVDKEKMILKIADLGLSRAFTVPMKSYTHEIVTLWYRAPEVLLGATHYSTSVDIWSIGCIFAEMVRKQALFPGDSELQQLLHIFKLLGTPTEEDWPGVTALRDWHEFPQWKAQRLTRAVPTLEPEGIDLLSPRDAEVRVALTLETDRFVAAGDVRQLAEDVESRAMPLDAATTVPGTVLLFGLFRRSAVAYSECRLVFAVMEMRVQSHECNSSTKL